MNRRKLLGLLAVIPFIPMMNKSASNVAGYRTPPDEARVLERAQYYKDMVEAGAVRHPIIIARSEPLPGKIVWDDNFTFSIPA